MRNILTSHKIFKYVALTWILLLISIIILCFDYNNKLNRNIINENLDIKFIIYPILSNLFYILVSYYNSQNYIINIAYLEILIIIVNLLFILSIIKKVLMLNNFNRWNLDKNVDIHKYHLGLILLLICVIWLSIMFLYHYKS